MRPDLGATQGPGVVAGLAVGESRVIGPLDRGETTTRVEAFVDGAFAFALTLLAISGDHIPTSIDELIVALKGLPAYAASFALVVKVWSSHVQWSRTFGLDDGTGQLD